MMKKIGSILIIMIGIFIALFVHHKKKYTLLRISPHMFINLEIAQTPQERARGLMFRKNLQKNQGMLFVFPKPLAHSFWMKNTLIPLDLIWLDHEKKIVYYQDEIPPCNESECRIYSPPADMKASYVIEIQSGLRKKLNLEKGKILNF